MAWYATVIVWLSMGHGAISSHQIGPFVSEEQCKEAAKVVEKMDKYPSVACYKGTR